MQLSFQLRKDLRFSKTGCFVVVKVAVGRGRYVFASREAFHDGVWRVEVAAIIDLSS